MADDVGTIEDQIKARVAYRDECAKKLIDLRIAVDEATSELDEAERLVRVGCDELLNALGVYRTDPRT
jgi:hypothetical protein